MQKIKAVYNDLGLEQRFFDYEQVGVCSLAPVLDPRTGTFALALRASNIDKFVRHQQAPSQPVDSYMFSGCAQASYEKLTQLISDQSSLPQGVFTLLLGKIYKRKK